MTVVVANQVQDRDEQDARANQAQIMDDKQFADLDLAIKKANRPIKFRLIADKLDIFSLRNLRERLQRLTRYYSYEASVVGDDGLSDVRNRILSVPQLLLSGAEEFFLSYGVRLTDKECKHNPKVWADSVLYKADSEKYSATHFEVSMLMRGYWASWVQRKEIGTERILYEMIASHEGKKVGEISAELTPFIGQNARRFNLDTSNNGKSAIKLA